VELWRRALTPARCRSVVNLWPEQAAVRRPTKVTAGEKSPQCYFADMDAESPGGHTRTYCLNAWFSRD